MFDVAGRSEDAQKLTWKNINEEGETATVKLERGKTSATRELPLTKKTMELMNEIRSENNKDGSVFSFNNAKALRVNLKR